MLVKMDCANAEGGTSGKYKTNSPQPIVNETNAEITINTGLTEVKHFMIDGHLTSTFNFRTFLEYHADGFADDNTIKIMRYALSSQSQAQNVATSSSDTIAAGTYAPGLISINGGEVKIQFGTSGTWYKQTFEWYAG